MTESLTPAMAPPSRDALDQLAKAMRAKADEWEYQNFRSGHYDDYGAGEEHRAQRCAEQVIEWADQLVSLLAVPPPQQMEAHQRQEIHDDQAARVPGVPSNRALGSIAEQSTGVVTDAERTEG